MLPFTPFHLTCHYAQLSPSASASTATSSSSTSLLMAAWGRDNGYSEWPSSSVAIPSGIGISRMWKESPNVEAGDVQLQRIYHFAGKAGDGSTLFSLLKEPPFVTPTGVLIRWIEMSTVIALSMEIS